MTITSLCAMASLVQGLIQWLKCSGDWGDETYLRFVPPLRPKNLKGKSQLVNKHLFP